MVKIIETKCTCKACGNVWYFDKRDEDEVKARKRENSANAMSNVGKSMMCCGGCFPALFIPDKKTVKVKDLDVCEKCGSKAVEKEQVEHEVDE